MHGPPALPIGEPSERNRSSVKRRMAKPAAGLIRWSIDTFASGLAHGFCGMLPMRMGVWTGKAKFLRLFDDPLFLSRKASRERLALLHEIYFGPGFALLAGGLVIRFASRREVWQIRLSRRDQLLGRSDPRQFASSATNTPRIACIGSLARPCR